MKDWPHAPPHRLLQSGTYMITAGTYQKSHFFKRKKYLAILENLLFKTAEKYSWKLEAWAVLSNHYHFLAHSESGSGESMKTLISELHTRTAIEINRLDNQKGRRVWYQFWDTHITYQASYFARMRYIHNNAVHHNIVDNAEEYQFCSAAWFNLHADRVLKNTVNSLKTDRLKVFDEF